MIEEEATVIEVKPEQVIVQTLRKSSCNSCAANKGCGTAVLSKAIGQKHSIISLSKSKAVEPMLFPGDRVIIGINETLLFSGSILAYLVPLAMMFAFALIADSFGSHFAVNGELHTIIGALLGLVSGMVISHFYIHKGRQRADFSPILVRKLIPVA